ncbi:MAG: acetyl-CoA carboxylase biotin carboxylase subunit [Flavobacteriales bacterium]
MKKILIANRGEIALRVMRTCKKMGINTVAIYSEADKNAPFVKFANEAFCVGPPSSNQSYLLGDKIIEIALANNVDGIHPGYGFLSENAGFSKKVKDAGITFIGPSAHAMEVMGSKLGAKAAVKDYGIPMVPGTEGAIKDHQEALKIAEEIGFPVLIKASAGGGGKGMRIVNNSGEFNEQLQRAQSEALSSFGDDAVFIEKYIGKPRHIEVQIMADNYGNVIYLFERECSIQRRHQKVVEEAPSSVLTAELRKQIGEDACKVAKACDYSGAGTVEFLYEDGKYYFLEMNTRLQVEHPVSEMITGLDLVELQIRVASGEELPVKQDDLKINGHSIEIRVYAEDPTNNFLPDIGTLKRYRIPKGPGIRVDDSMEEGMTIPIYYDPMIAKLITHANTREEAIKLMTQAIDNYEISGVETTLQFCRFAINHEAFVSGDFDTKFVEKYFTNSAILNELDENEESILAFGAALILENEKKAFIPPPEAESPKGWKLRKNF